MILFTGHCTSGKRPQARLMLADRAACDETLSAIRTAGGECFAVPTDVTSEDDVLRLLGEVETRLGGLDLLVNNAGILIEKPLLASSVSWRSTCAACS